MVRFEIFMSVRMMMFWILASCRFVGRYQSLGEHTVFIFRAEVTSPHGTKNPEEYYHPDHLDNLKSLHPVTSSMYFRNPKHVFLPAGE